MSMKNSSGTIENQTCDLLACSAVPRPTATPRAPPIKEVTRLFKKSNISLIKTINKLPSNG